MTDTGISDADGVGAPEPTEPIEQTGLTESTEPAESTEPVTLTEPVTMTEPVTPTETQVLPPSTEWTAPVLTEPVSAEPVLAEPVLAEPVLAEPVLAEPVLAAPVPDSILTEQERAEAAARRTRIRRNVLRWTGAVVLTLAVGGGIAFAISVPQRTDIPGLGTAADGRYAFPTLSLPTLPPGQPAPSASANTIAQQHLADIRTLLLPKPNGATTPAAKTSGWFGDADTLFADQQATKVLFAEYGLRHAATTTWTTPDGATTKIYLLQFTDGPAATSVLGGLLKNVTSTSSTSGTTGLSSTLSGVQSGAVTRGVNLTANVAADYTEATGNGKITRYGTFSTGDTLAVVVQSGPAKSPFAPFAQVMTLQAELLQ